MGNGTTRFIAVMITLVWSVSICAAIISPAYSPPVEVHAIMGVVAGALFGRDAIKRLQDHGGNGNGNGRP